MKQNEYEYLDYKSFNNEQLKLREPLNAVYKLLGASDIRLVIDDMENYSGVDVVLKTALKDINVEEKIQFSIFKHTTEMLLELDHFKKRDNNFHQYGWIQKESVSHVLVDYCSKNGEFFIYDFQKLLTSFSNLFKGVETGALKDKEIIKHVREKLDQPNLNIYIPEKTNNKYYRTRNLVIDRSILKPFLRTSGVVKFNSKSILNRSGKEQKYIVEFHKS